MRIVCPRCVAQYEVDESAIPETGREVQCANCENIWFQDYIEMLPTADDTNAPAEEDRGVFDDLDGKSEASFYSERGAGPVTVSAHEDDTIEDDVYDDDMDDFDDEDDFDDDDAPATNIPVPTVNEDVLDVLRSEAAFSSARDTLDAAAADALDGDGEAIKAALDDTATAEPEPDLEDLSAFLDAYAEEEPEDTPEPDPEPEPEVEEPDLSFDPLADLDAIRSQLNDIGAEQSDEPEYEPNLPADDPIEDTATEADDDFEDEPEDDTPEFDAAALSAALDMDSAEDEDDVETDTDEEDDDFDALDDGPRHAYRADAPVSDTVEDAVEDLEDDIEETVEEEIDEAEADLAAALNGISTADADPIEDDTPQEPEDDDSSAAGIAAAAAAVTGAAAAVGMTRPRASGTRTRARAMPGFEQTPEPAPTPDLPADDILPDVADDIDIDTIEDDIAAVVDTERKADQTRRPRGNRKAMLPDVEELDASLRSDRDEPRRRDREMMDAHDAEVASAGKGGFRRAFIWTLFIIALLIALYVLRPQLVAAVPAAAMVLDPYAAAIDTIRGLINGILG